MPEREISMLQAISEGLREAMEEDPRVILLGEDIVGGAGLGPPYEGSMGGTFGATKGLLAEFGPERVRDTPISEAGFTGVAVGAAASGLRPVVDMMWSSFTPLAFDQIFNQAAKMRYMFGGQVSVPLVLRMAIGAGLGAAGQHSDTLYSLFTHIPGLKVVVPSGPKDAKALLKASIADDDPVLYFEHMRLYARKGPMPPDYQAALGSASVVRSGRDVTLIGVAYMVEVALQAAEELRVDGIEAEVVDPRSLSPLDLDTLVESARRTRRVVIVDESPPRCSIAVDLSAQIAEACFDSLVAPPIRVTSPHSPVPLSPPLEAAYIPDRGRVASAVRKLMIRQG